MCVHLKPTALHAFIWKGIYSNTPFSVLVYCLYCTQKNICSPYSSISSPPPILFFYITGDMRCITHSTILREEMVVGFIDHLSCHLQRLEWRTEAIFWADESRKMMKEESRRNHPLWSVELEWVVFPDRDFTVVPTSQHWEDVIIFWQLVLCNPWLRVHGQGFWAS